MPQPHKTCRDHSHDASLRLRVEKNSNPMGKKEYTSLMQIYAVISAEAK